MEVICIRAPVNSNLVKGQQYKIVGSSKYTYKIKTYPQVLYLFPNEPAQATVRQYSKKLFTPTNNAMCLSKNIAIGYGSKERLSKCIVKKLVKHKAGIYIKNQQSDSWKELLNKYFNKYSPTHYATGFFVPTYKNPACTIQQCHSARRSFKDLLTIVNTYYEVSIEELANYLLRQTLEGGDMQLFMQYCNDVEEFVWRRTSVLSKTSSISTFIASVRYGYDNYTCIPKYSLDDIIKAATNLENPINFNYKSLKITI